MASSAETLEQRYKNAVESFKQKKTKTALENLKVIVLDENTTRKIRIKSYELLAKICVEKEQFEKAIKLYKNTLNHLKESEWKLKARMYNNIGLLYNRLKDNEESIKYQELCYEAIKKHGDKRGESIAMRNLGRAYTLQGDHVKSLRLYEDSLKIKRKLGDNLGMARNYESMAEDFEFNEEFDKAIEYYEKALKIYLDGGILDEVERVKRGIQKVKDWKKDIEEY